MLLSHTVATLIWISMRIRRNNRGEGVVSAAIAVLVMAFLGAAMYVGFSGVLRSSQAKTQRQVDCIGLASAASSCGGDATTPPTT